MTTQTFDLNLIPGGVLPVLNVSQYDVQKSAFRTTLYHGDNLFTIPANTSATVEGYKPDGTGFSYQVRSLSGHDVVFDLTQQMTAVSGDVLTEVRLKKGTEIVGTSNFILRVERAPLQDDSVISETFIPLVQQALEIASQLAEYIQQTMDAASSAASSASSASGSAQSAAASATQAAGYNDNVLQLYNALEAAKAAANQAAAAANQAAAGISGMSATATTLAEGSNATVSYDPATKVFTFGVPRGATGQSGIYTEVSGLYAMYVDSNGYLHIVTNGEDIGADDWSINAAGQLVYHITEG